MADFDPTALLSAPIDNFKAPPPAPIGTFLGMITKREFENARNEKKTPLVKFTIVPQEAMPDVDEEQLRTWQEALAESDKQMSAVEFKLEMWLTPEALYRLKELGRDHVKVTEEEAQTTGELIEAMVGRQVVFTLVQAPNKKNPERPYINIGSTAAVPE